MTFLVLGNEPEGNSIQGRKIVFCYIFPGHVMSPSLPIEAARESPGRVRPDPSAFYPGADPGAAALGAREAGSSGVVWPQTKGTLGLGGFPYENRQTTGYPYSNLFSGGPRSQKWGSAK